MARAAATTLGLAAAVAVVAMAARAPLSRATPVDARSAQAPTTALFMLLAGTGIVMLGALVLVAWSGRRRKDDPPEREPTRVEVHWIWKLVAILVPFAPGGGAGRRRGDRDQIRCTRGLGSEASRSAVRLPVPPRRAAPAAAFAVPSWLPWTLLAIVGIALVTGAVVLWLRRERPPTEPPEASATHAAVEAAIGALAAEADPRRAVIAAYGGDAAHAR